MPCIFYLFLWRLNAASFQHLISVEIPQVLDYFDILLRVLPDNARILGYSITERIARFIII